jgi:hypothetical protein
MSARLINHSINQSGSQSNNASVRFRTGLSISIFSEGLM